MTRGRQSNTDHVATSPGHKPYQQAAPEPVLAAIMQRDDGDLSATEQIRQAQEWSGGTSHLLQLWSAAVRQTLHPDIDEQIKARLADSEACRYDREHARKALQPSGAAPLSSSAMTSAPSSTRSPPRRWTATGPSPASCTIALQQLVPEIRDEADTVRGLDRRELEA
jgi:hypothetical protein